MTRKFRTILFLICVLLLFSTAPSVILYSQGYRIDFANKKIVQTGALYFKIIPKSVEINVKPITQEPFSRSLMNKEIKKQTNFLTGSTLIENLLPATYEIEIKKQDYHDWKKSLKVEEKLVTENKNLILVPKNPDFMLLHKNIESVWLSPNKEKIIIQKNTEQGWRLEIFDVEKNEKTTLLNSKDCLASPSNTLLDLEFALDSKRILLKTLQKNPEQKIIYFVLELSNEPLLFCLNFLEQDIKNLYFGEKNSKKIFFTEQSSQNKKQDNENLITNLLFVADYEKKEVESLIVADLISYKIIDGNIIWLSKNGFIYKSNLNGETLETFNLKPIDLFGKNYEITAFSGQILLTIDDSLFFLNEKTKEFEKISDNINNFKLSSDNKKIAYFNNSEIWIFFLEEQKSQPQKHTYEKVFLTRFSEKINNCLWLSNHYLILSIGNNEQTIKITEIDDRDRINMYDLAKFENQNIFFSNISKQLYLLNQNNLYASKELY
jgi:hypothetical protein